VDLPLCSFDLRTGMFCPHCSEKLRRGLYSDLDVNVMKIFLELEKRFTKLRNAGYVKSVDGGDTIFVILQDGDLKDLEIREIARIRKTLSKELGKPVRLVEDHPDPLKFIERLSAPARIVAVNKIWLPDGSEEIRIIFDYERNLKMSEQAVIKVVEEVKKMKLSIDFERRFRRSFIQGRRLSKKALVKR